MTLGSLQRKVESGSKALPVTRSCLPVLLPEAGLDDAVQGLRAATVEDKLLVTVALRQCRFVRLKSRREAWVVNLLNLDETFKLV